MKNFLKDSDGLDVVLNSLSGMDERVQQRWAK